MEDTIVCRMCLLFFYWAGVALTACGQHYITVTGKIIDSQNSIPIPFVNIQLNTSGLGTSTNSEGHFIFKFPEKFAKDTLIISCIGYQTKREPCASLNRNAVIRLIPATVELAEITINSPNGLDILKTALSKIPENYDTAPVQLTAFYRENLLLGDFQMAYSESVLEVHKKFKTEKDPNDQIRIIKGRKKQVDFGSDGQFYFWLSGISNSARGALAEDLVKYNQARMVPFNPRNFKYYQYNYSETIREGNTDLIVLEIIPKQNNRRGLINMKVYIDDESFAIVKYDLELTDAGVRYVSRKDKGLGQAIMSAVTGAQLDYHRFRMSNTYKRYQGKWYLNTVVRRWEILVNSKKRNMVERKWQAELDFIVTDIDRENVRPITQGDIGGTKTSLGSLLGSDTDEAFWEHYNVLKTEIPDSLRFVQNPLPADSVRRLSAIVPNRQNGFTRADTLRGKLTPLRTCFDVTFYHLDVAVNMDERSVKGSNLMRFKVVEPLQKMQVDLYANMKINSITHKEIPLAFTREFNAVFIEFKEPLLQGTEQEIRIFYEGVPKTPDWSIPMNGGILWDKDSLGNPWAEAVTQGSGASVWWPNKDHQSDEPDSMKIWITVPSQFSEISNGRLVHKTPLKDSMTRYEWYVSYPINNYNVTFNIGKYAHFSDEYISDDTLKIDYYVMEYNLDRAKKMFRQV
ncbi:MAG TPA: carboxypeptidase-like regulatory domain-containing protein, partial [Chryseolinea sp.]